MAQHDDLEVLGTAGAKAQHQQGEDTTGQDVQQRRNHAPWPPVWRTPPGFDALLRVGHFLRERAARGR
jgi:hypothetical protein